MTDNLKVPVDATIPTRPPIKIHIKVHKGNIIDLPFTNSTVATPPLAVGTDTALELGYVNEREHADIDEATLLEDKIHIMKREYQILKREVTIMCAAFSTLVFLVVLVVCLTVFLGLAKSTTCDAKAKTT